MSRHTAILRILAERIVEEHLREQRARTVDAQSEAEKNTQSAKIEAHKEQPHDELA